MHGQIVREIKRLKAAAFTHNRSFDFYTALPAVEHSRDDLLRATRRRAAWLRGGGEAGGPPPPLGGALDRASFTTWPCTWRGRVP